MWSHVFLLIFLQPLLISSRCPSPCICDTTNGQKRIHCDLADSSIPAPLDDIDSDVQILEITPLRGGPRNAYGPDVGAAFDGFHDLTKLVIKNNGVQTLPVGTAQQLAHLASLDLSGNAITSVGDLSLSTFRELTVLSLGLNQISSLSARDLQSLTSLQALNLADNSIATIPSSAFRSQGMLRVLDLRNNVLRALPDDLFDGVRRVERLDLRGNQFSVLPRGTIVKSASFDRSKYLLLDNNHLSTVPREFVQAWQSDHTLSDITLYGNPFVCDEGLEPLVNWLKTDQGVGQVCEVLGRTGDKAKSGTCPVCDSPSNLHGRPIDSLTGHDFGTGNPPSETSTFSAKLINGRPVDGSSNSDERESARFTVTTESRSVSRRGSSGDSDIDSSRRRTLPPGTRCSGSTCYSFSSRGEKNWDDAEFACEKLGGKLLEITSAAVQRQILTFLSDVVREDMSFNSITRGWWIGVRFDPRKRAFALASSGRSLPYTKWGSGQPNGFSTGQDCVEMWDTGDWGDLECQSNVNNKYICQIPASSI